MYKELRANRVNQLKFNVISNLSMEKYCSKIIAYKRSVKLNKFRNSIPNSKEHINMDIILDNINATVNN